MIIRGAEPEKEMGPGMGTEAKTGHGKEMKAEGKL